MKRQVKRVIKRTEIPCAVLTLAGYPICIGLLILAAPTITTTQLAALQLFIGFTAALWAVASTLKNDDTEE